MDNGNIALRFEMKEGDDAKDDMTEVRCALPEFFPLDLDPRMSTVQVWKQLRDAKAKELELKKQINEMYQQKVRLAPIFSTALGLFPTPRMR